jgi:hypothetical protein
MIVLEAALSGNGIFFAGELLTCTLTFINKPEKPIIQVDKGSARSELKSALSIDTLRNLAGMFLPLATPIVGSSTQTPASTEMVTDRRVSVDTGNQRYLNPLNLVHQRKHSVRSGIKLSKGMIYTRSMSSDFGTKIETLNQAKLNDAINEEQSEDTTKSLNTLVPRPSHSITSRQISNASDVYEKEEKLELKQSKVRGNIGPSWDNEDHDGAESEQSDPSNSSNASPRHPNLKIITNANLQETVAWAFAQITGHVTVDRSYIKLAPFLPLSEKIMYSTPNSKNNGGGGTLTASNPELFGKFCNLERFIYFSTLQYTTNYFIL